ncbi:MAG: pyridoxamine 5'-phosphate oxidase family protein [Eubacteriales bacterium]|jgi:nitroimidazol reductase NimA-like FMN-containing flavoprotein (pyridoxamine 5'-phosphate oxidase superfamily)
MREMRRKERQLSRQRALEVLKNCEYGMLATVNEDGTPYCVPVSPVLMGERIYFHCAPEGHKLENLLRQPRVCFTCVGRTQLQPQNFTTFFESAVVFGRARMVEEREEKVEALLEICRKFAAENMANAPKAIEASLPRTGICCIEIQEISGKSKGYLEK